MSAAPERIHGWQHTQLSIARNFGGLSYQGHGYTIAYSEPGQPLVRDDVLRQRPFLSEGDTIDFEKLLRD